jgi:hypothetical protein
VTSRDGDMQLHTHCLVLNRGHTSEDGVWRALDGRALLTARTGAGAFYNRTLEAELTRRLGVAWRDRPDGLRELDGVDDDLIDAFSTRRRAITAELTLLVAAYEDRYGVPPPSAVVSAMAQSATLTTRRRKQPCEGPRRSTGGSRPPASTAARCGRCRTPWLPGIPPTVCTATVVSSRCTTGWNARAAPRSPSTAPATTLAARLSSLPSRPSPNSTAGGHGSPHEPRRLDDASL